MSDREELAKHRFFIYTGKLGDTYQFNVCDADLTPKTLAKFKYSVDAELFLTAVRKRFIEAV